MATLRDIRNRIAGIKSIEQITSAMKMVSSVKLRKAQRQAESARPFFDKIEKMLFSLALSDRHYDNPLLNTPTDREVKNIIIFIIAGDKGLCGSFNSALLKTTDLYLKNLSIEHPDVTPQLVLIGNKAIDHYNKRSYDIIYREHNAFQPLDYNLVLKSSKAVIERFLSGEADSVEIFYNHFVNMLKQEPTSFQLFPLIPADVLENMKEVQKGLPPDYIFEPSISILVDRLIDQYVDLKIWRALLESNAAEQASRLFAMDKATQNANDLLKDLNLQFNNARQAAITNEMLEIVSGAESLKK